MQPRKFPNIEDTVQVNMKMPKRWREILEQLARECSLKEKRDITYIDMIRRSISKDYRLEEIS